jgi:membrane peptidoglycan carboxypeptidase
MQLVKNLLLHQRQTLDRKVNEIILAVVVEWLFSKDEIMAMYLNTAYFGAGAYGVEAAARRFFGRSIGSTRRWTVWKPRCWRFLCNAPVSSTR